MTLTQITKDSIVEYLQKKKMGHYRWKLMRGWLKEITVPDHRRYIQSELTKEHCTIWGEVAIVAKEVLDETP